MTSVFRKSHSACVSVCVAANRLFALSSDNCLTSYYRSGHSFTVRNSMALSLIMSLIVDICCRRMSTETFFSPLRCSVPKRLYSLDASWYYFLMAGIGHLKDSSLPPNCNMSGWKLTKVKSISRTSDFHVAHCKLFLLPPVSFQTPNSLLPSVSSQIRLISFP